MVYERKKYPDGGVYAVITEFGDKEVPMITERINTYEDLFFIKSLKDVLDTYGKKADLFIPCMFQQQHDKRFSLDQSFELKLVAEFINSCNFRRVIIFHPHSDVTPALVNNSIVSDNSDFIHEVLSLIVGEKRYGFDSNAMQQNLVLMSSDANGFKPLIKLADTIFWEGTTESAAKSRDPHTHKLTQQVSTMDFKGKDVLIVDDICVYGGTFVGLGKILKDRNVGKLYLAVSHTTVKEPSKDLAIYFDRIFTTNSKYESYDTMRVVGNKIKPLFEVIKTIDL